MLFVLLMIFERLSLLIIRCLNRKTNRIPVFLVLKKDWETLVDRWAYSPEEEREDRLKNMPPPEDPGQAEKDLVSSDAGDEL